MNTVNVVCPTCEGRWYVGEKSCKTCKNDGHINRAVRTGDAATVQIGSDRYACTVIWVSPSAHQIKLQRDKCKPTAPIAYTESQTYICVSDPDGEIEKAQIRGPKNEYYICGSGRQHVTIGVKHPYRDPSF